MTRRNPTILHSLVMLALESNYVVALRCMKLMQGGARARREAERMVSEKIRAAIQTGVSLVAGASGEDIVHRYRRRVAANAKRLSGPKRRVRRRK